MALDFVNTVGNRLGSPQEYVTDAAACRRWAERAGIWRGRQLFRLSAAELLALRKLREELYRVFLPFAQNRASEAAARALNRRLTTVLAQRELRREDGSYFWDWRAPSPARILSGEIVLSAAELLTSGAFHDLRQCQDASCGWLFLDRSRSSPRRWCSMRDCGNRAKARRFRTRG